MHSTSIRRSLLALVPALAAFIGLGLGNPAQGAPDTPTKVAVKHSPDKSRKFVATGPGIEAFWWTIFHDPALDALEREALVANQDLQQGVARVVEARQQSLAAAADFYPHLDANLRASRQRTTNTGPIQHARFIGNFAAAAGPGSAAPSPITGIFGKPLSTQPLTSTYDDFRTPLTLSYEIDVFGRIRGAYDKARAAAQAEEADRRAVELSLTAQVASSVFMLRALDAETAVFERAVTLREDAVRLQRERTALGGGSALDVARAAVELDNAQSDLTDAVRQRKETENALAVLCGEVASNFHVPMQPLSGQRPPAVPTGVPATLLAQRPDLIEGERRIAAAGEGIRVARAELLPSFNIEGDAGFESAHSGELAEWQSRTWDLLATVKVPIFEGGKNLANLRAARAQREEALAAYRQTALIAFKEVENALVDLRQRAAQATARDKAAADAQQVLKYSQDRYLEGAVTYFEVIDAQRLLLSAELGRIETLDARYTATVELIRALGGSYEQSR